MLGLIHTSFSIPLFHLNSAGLLCSSWESFSYTMFHNLVSGRILESITEYDSFTFLLPTFTVFYFFSSVRKQLFLYSVSFFSFFNGEKLSNFQLLIIYISRIPYFLFEKKMSIGCVMILSYSLY